jgi:hypothetical protein
MSAVVSEPIANEAPRRPAGWLYSLPIDVAVLAVPVLAAVVAYAVQLSHGGGGRVVERMYATFVAQFVLGNTTHVILTFLLIALRRDLLAPVPGQKNILVFGSAGAFVVSLALFWATAITFPRWIDFGLTIGFIFAQHHRLSQVKGLWALYSLRAKLPPAPFERKIQNVFVPVGLLLLVMRLLCFPRESFGSFATMVPIPGVPAPLPFEGVYAIVAAYAIFAVVGIVALVRANASMAKILYVGTHLALITFTLYTPLWGAVVTSGVHGLEYYLLSARMLAPLEGEGLRLSRGGVWAVMFAAMAPAIVVGTLNMPFTSALAIDPQTLLVATLVLNAVVMAHYFADAFLYRLRMPGVRKVVLARMRF